MVGAQLEQWGEQGWSHQKADGDVPTGSRPLRRGSSAAPACPIAQVASTPWSWHPETPLCLGACWVWPQVRVMQGLGSSCSPPRLVLGALLFSGTGQDCLLCSWDIPKPAPGSPRGHPCSAVRVFLPQFFISRVPREVMPQVHSQSPFSGIQGGGKHSWKSPGCCSSTG